ncbi:MAG: F0F1 ATP synthase subunit B [Oscillospiraceae bacterium]|nr:F0F1 ATP synthase subunit B [Oscillospiraceae bacterium]
MNEPLIGFRVPEICFAWINLFVFFLVVKKYCFKPIKAVIDRRAAEIRGTYAKAEAANEKAKRLEEEYIQKLAAAKFEAAQIISVATATSEAKAETIIEQAKQKAMQILEKAQLQIKKEKDDSLREVFDEVADVVLITASKLLEKEMSIEDHREVIDKVLMEIGAGVK